MASYGTFITACGFTYHGPKGHIGFAPKITPESFKAPFTAAEGWGAYSQQRDATTFSASVAVAYGKLAVNKISVELDKDHKAAKAEVMLDNKVVPSSFSQTGNRCEIVLNDPASIKTGTALSLKIS
jgi:hypothetical protein